MWTCWLSAFVPYLYNIRSIAVWYIHALSFNPAGLFVFPSPPLPITQ